MRNWYSIVVMVLFVGCSSSYRVFTDYNQEADFSGYHTYRFLENKTSEYSTLVQQRIRQTVDSLLQERGYREDAENPDLWIAVDGRVQEKRTVQVDRTSFDPYYWGWDGYQVREQRYKEGSLVIDMVDVTTKQLVWQGGVTGVVNGETISREEIEKAMVSIFERYPYRAGESAPVSE